MTPINNSLLWLDSTSQTCHPAGRPKYSRFKDFLDFRNRSFCGKDYPISNSSGGERLPVNRSGADTNQSALWWRPSRGTGILTHKISPFGNSAKRISASNDSDAVCEKAEAMSENASRLASAKLNSTRIQLDRSNLSRYCSPSRSQRDGLC